MINVNDVLVGVGLVCIVVGCTLIMPALGLVAAGGIVLATGLIRMRGTYGPD